MAFEGATKLPRSYLLLDKRPETDDRYRVRTGNVNDKNQPQLSTSQIRKNVNTCSPINHFSFRCYQ